MIANPDKLKAIMLKANIADLSGRTIKIKDKIIKTENEVESLGMIIDNKLTYRKYISTICKSAAGKLNILKRMKMFLTDNARLYYAKTYVLSSFNYCSIVWNYCGLVEIHKMEKSTKEHCALYTMIMKLNMNSFQQIIMRKPYTKKELFLPAMKYIRREIT